MRQHELQCHILFNVSTEPKEKKNRAGHSRFKFYVGYYSPWEMHLYFTSTHKKKKKTKKQHTVPDLSNHVDKQVVPGFSIDYPHSLKQSTLTR